MSIYCVKDGDGEWMLNSPSKTGYENMCDQFGDFLGIDKKTECFQIRINPKGTQKLTYCSNGFVLVDSSKKLYQKLDSEFTDEEGQCYLLNGNPIPNPGDIDDLLSTFDLDMDEDDNEITFDIYEWVDV